MRLRVGPQSLDHSTPMLAQLVRNMLIHLVVPEIGHRVESQQKSAHAKAHWKPVLSSVLNVCKLLTIPSEKCGCMSVQRPLPWIK
jgi:hypothetical protein